MNDLESRSDVVVLCSFCKKTEQEVEVLIEGQGDVYICNECVRKCSDELIECSFCLTPLGRKDIRMSSESDRHICSKCVKICVRLNKKQERKLKGTGNLAV